MPFRTPRSGVSWGAERRRSAAAVRVLMPTKSTDTAVRLKFGGCGPAAASPLRCLEARRVPRALGGEHAPHRDREAALRRVAQDLLDPGEIARQPAGLLDPHG